MNPRRHLILWAGIILMLLMTTATPIALAHAAPPAATTTTYMTLTPVADSYVSASSAGSNYGSATALHVDHSPDAHGYLRFDIPRLKGRTIAKAMLKLYSNTGNASGITSRSVSNNAWSEKGINYRNKPILGGVLAASGALHGAGWVSLNVSSYIKTAGAHSFGVLTPGSIGFSVASRESGAYAPRLVLTLHSNVSPTPTNGSVKYVFDIWFENKGYNQIWNTSSAPYITSLGKSYTRATNFHAQFHPSLPDYIAFFGGNNYGITNDCSPSSSCHANAKNLADLLEAKGLNWKFYEESMPGPCYIKTSGDYAPKHDPAVYFDDIRNNSARCNSHVVNYSNLTTDLKSASSTPSFAFITPNLCNDMHDCSVKTGDTWLKNHLPAILNSPACKVDKCLVIVTFDEDEGSEGQHIPTIFAGSGARTGGVTSSKHYTHYSTLRTIEYIFGLPTLTSNDANASPMTDMLR